MRMVSARRQVSGALSGLVNFVPWIADTDNDCPLGAVNNAERAIHLTIHRDLADTLDRRHAALLHAKHRAILREAPAGQREALELR